MANELKLPSPVSSKKEPKSVLGRWIYHGHRLDDPSQLDHHTVYPWYWVLWLTGVDYFSTLGYQPGTALLAAGAMSPIATAILVAVTLLGALPVYSQVAARSFAGQGSIAILESLLPGWFGKILVLALIGFAATDFVITMTLSAADAAVHMVENQLLHSFVGEHSLLITLALLSVLTLVFLKGFKEAVQLASIVCIPYIILNLIVLGRCFYEITQHQELIFQWKIHLDVYGSGPQLFILASFIFPRLALGMSGFETGVSAMPLIMGTPADKTSAKPEGQIKNTRRLLLCAALIMSVLLLASSFIANMLVPEQDYRHGGAAYGRVIAYLAHRYMGLTWGTIYDFSTIAILWFAGASAMTGLLNLIPRYMPRFGMAPQWISYDRPLILLIFIVNVFVTLAFNADVEAQSGAYATGVLVLILSAAVAVSISLLKEYKEDGQHRNLFRFVYFVLVSVVFSFTLIDNIVERPDGVIIASIFIGIVILSAALSRYWRSTELRVSEVTFDDQESAILWLSMVGKTVHMIPMKNSTSVARRRKSEEVRQYYRVDGTLAFVHVNLIDNRSQFLAPLKVRVREENNNLVVEVFGAIAIANTIAYISQLISPISLFLGLTRQNLMSQALRYLMWGEGETGLMVYTILLRSWSSMKEEECVRPLIFLMSE